MRRVLCWLIGHRPQTFIRVFNRRRERVRFCTRCRSDLPTTYRQTERIGEGF